MTICKIWMLRIHVIYIYIQYTHLIHIYIYIYIYIKYYIYTFNIYIYTIKQCMCACIRPSVHPSCHMSIYHTHSSMACKVQVQIAYVVCVPIPALLNRPNVSSILTGSIGSLPTFCTHTHSIAA